MKTDPVANKAKYVARLAELDGRRQQLVVKAELLEKKRGEVVALIAEQDEKIAAASTANG